MMIEMMSTQWPKRLAANLLASSGALTLMERADGRRSNLLRVLSYHRVDALNGRADWLDPSLINATPADFAQQMQYLARHYRVVSASEVVDILTLAEEIPPYAVLITFDDGYRDFAEQAWPIMREFDLPVTVFIATAYPGDPSRIFWWDRLYQGLKHTTQAEIVADSVGRLPLSTEAERAAAWRRLKAHIRAQEHHQAMAFLDQVMAALGVTARRGDALLNWDEIRQLATEGVTFAAHTRTHPILSHLTPEQIHEEVAGSLTDLECQVGKPLPIFSYPHGGPDTFDDSVMNVLRELGIVAAFTTVQNTVHIGKHRSLMLHRIGTDSNDSFPEFRFRLTSAYANLKRVQHFVLSLT
jgi:peptidoglycan/xylan/chitin deacetylase (PgdA/CDA1 family)